MFDKTKRIVYFVGMDSLKRVISIVGSQSALAKMCGIKSSMAVSQWFRRGVPVERVLQLSQLTDYKVTPHDLDPTHYPNPRDGLPVDICKADSSK